MSASDENSPNFVSTDNECDNAQEAETVEGEIVDDEVAAEALASLVQVAPSFHVEGTPTNPALVYLAALAPSGRRTMRGKLEAVCLMLTGKRDLDVLPWHLLRYEHVAAIRSRLEAKGLAPASVNATLYAVRGVVKACWNLGLMSADDYGRVRNVAPARGSRLPAGRSLSSGELAALLDACSRDKSPSGVRDAALLGVLYIGGLRRSEVAKLQVSDFDRESGALKVRGKGNKERLAYLGEASHQAIVDWISLRGEEPGTLFAPVRKNGSIYKDKGITDQALYKTLRKRALQAGVKSFSPHDLRRTFVGDLLERGADIVTVQQLAGHASVSTTARYDRRGEETKKKAAHSLHLPYRRADR